MRQTNVSRLKGSSKAKAQIGFTEIAVAIAYNPESYGLGNSSMGDCKALTCLEHLNLPQGLLAVIDNELLPDG